MTPAARSDRLEDPFGLVGRVLAEKFRAESVVARGGFGVLYRGTHLTLQRPIAIKVLRTTERMHGSMRDAVRAAFEREAQMVARLSHPAIVHVIEFGVEPSREAPLLWMVLEWIEGKPLSVVLRERNGQRYTPTETLALMRPVLQALAYAHDQGLAHRDLKPANIMVTPTRHGPSVKLIDFGIAKAMDEGEAASDGETQTQSVMAVYSPRYAAPEQVGRARTGPWTDVHALGLILTEMLVGHPAYTAPATESTQLMSEVLNPVRPTPGRVGIDAGGWEDVLRRCLAIRGSDRPANAGEMLDELERTITTGRSPAEQSGMEISGSTSGIVGTHVSGSTSNMTGGPPVQPWPSSAGPSRRTLVVAAGVTAVLVVAGFFVGAWLSKGRRSDEQITRPVMSPSSVAAMPDPAAVVPPSVAPTQPPAPVAVVPANAPPTSSPLPAEPSVVQPVARTAPSVRPTRVTAGTAPPTAADPSRATTHRTTGTQPRAVPAHGTSSALPVID